MAEVDRVTDPTDFTVIIPAHNEEAVIRRCLETALAGAPAGHRTQFIVAANGCDDATAEVARAMARQVLVLELPQGSKPAAMNAANARARHFPRIYLDADVRCDYASLLALAAALRRPGVMAASPSLRMDLSRSSRFVKSYYRVWLTQPYVTRNMVGSGCYGLSRAGYEKIGPFPPIVGDDIWVHSRFPEGARINVPQDKAGRPVCFTVSPPRRVIDQIRVETRRRLGNRELRRLYPSPHYAGSNSVGDLGQALRRGAGMADIAIYLGIKALVRMRAMIAGGTGKAIAWERDLAAREV